MEYEVRNGKFYLKSLDGEFELTPNEIEQKIQYAEGLKKNLEKQLYYIGNKSLSIEDYCKSGIEEISRIDLFIENFTNALEKQYRDSKNPNEILKIIDIFIQELTAAIKNPLLKDRKKINKYFVEKIKLVKLLFSGLPQPPTAPIPNEKYKTRLLFKVGLLFAKGEMNKYFTVNSEGATVMNNNFTAPKIAKELGNDNYNKYILASINNYTNKENGNKNIFNSPDMMTKIISHCKAENIPVDSYFLSRYLPNKTKTKNSTEMVRVP